MRSAGKVKSVVACAALLSCSCLSADYGQVRVFQAPADEEIEALAPGVSDVGEALERLGAPVYVTEVGLGLALAWGWERTSDWNVQVSAPIGDVQGRVSYTSASLRTRGLVLFFDESCVLTRMRRGYLSELLPRRQNPRDVDDDLTAP